MAEVHLIGQLKGASGFPDHSLFCKWKMDIGDRWKLMAGECKGQTHLDSPPTGMSTNWSYPLDIHLAAKGLTGEPRLHFQVWHQDSAGRNELYGYGCLYLPLNPGFHRIDVGIWRPQGTTLERLRRLFVGGAAQLNKPEAIYNDPDLSHLRTEPMGQLHLELTIVTKNFEKFGVVV